MGTFTAKSAMVDVITSRATGSFDVVGAQSATAYFARQTKERLAHGYLFSGPAGVGKKTFALRLAQSLLCETPKQTLLGYCDRCPACTMVRAGTHPDLIRSEGTIKIGKDGGSALHDEELSARDLVREMSLRGYRSESRIVVLGDASFATHEAANALLKFFEEPPAGVVVIVTSSASGSLLETIRSRFVEVPFGPLSAADVQRVLEADGVAPDRAALAASVSLGSIVRARAVLNDDDAGSREASFAWFADAVSGVVPDGSFLALDDRSLTGAEKRQNVGDLIEIVRIAARDWAAMQIAGPGAILLAGDQRDRLARLPARDLQSIVTMLAALGDVERLARSNVSAGLVYEFLRVQLAAEASPQQAARQR